MRLLSVATPYGARLGAVDGADVVDLSAAYAELLASRGAARPRARADVDLPPNMTAFLAEGEGARRRAEEAIAFARTERGRATRTARRDVTLLPVVTRPSKVICVGLNYRDHAEETGAKIPEHPVFFSKFTLVPDRRRPADRDSSPEQPRRL